MSEERKLFVKAGGSTFRGPTPEEKAEAEERWAQIRAIEAKMEALDSERIDLRNKCPHTVRYDERGIRRCAGCGIVTGMGNL